MQLTSETLAKGAQGPESANLDPQVIARNKARRLRQYNTVQIPALRLVGSVLLSLVVILYQRFGSASTGSEWAVPLLIGYALASWALIYTLYGKAGPVDLGLVFLIIDVPIWTLVLYATGGEHSWLFIVLPMRVIDQTHTSFRRALYFGQFVTVCYVAMILYLQHVDHHEINWADEIGKIFLMYASCLYASLVALAVEKTQKRVKASFHMTRELAVQLNEKSIQLEASREEILEAKEAAESANIAKSQFLATMSHELRTPMNAILGMLHLLQNTELNARQRDYATKSESSTKTLLSLINDILDFSKVEAGKMTLENEPFEIERVLRDLAVVLSANSGNKDIEIMFDVDPHLPPVVVGDALRLQQVLLNLSSNAIKFTSQGEVVLSLRQQKIGPESVDIEFAVRDSGIGIAPEHQTSIFSGFSQAEASTTRRFGGTGLGLAISKRIVDLMGGEIQLESKLGAGSTFSFVVQFELTAGESKTEATPTLDMTAEGHNVPVPKRVLVVEDNALSSALTLRMIQSKGWEVDVAGSDSQAIEKIHAAAVLSPDSFPYPLVYTNWEMSGMDGWELARKIRQLASEWGQAQPTVIMVTSHGRQVLAQRSEQEQSLIDGYISKPMTAKMLVEAYANAKAGNSGIRKLTQGRSSQRQLAGMRVLVVEDNLINQQVAEELLSSEGALVSLAANGQAGVEAVMAAAPQFDVVLMDIQMPVLDGYGATRLIRQELKLDTLPIVAMTANALDSDREACLAVGMNEHIGKPFDMAKLVSLLIRVTGFSATPSIAPAETTPEPAADGQLVVPGLDLSTALARMAGMHKLYARTARDFCGVLLTTLDALHELVRKQDWATMRMQLHTLKGNAGTLGASALAVKAAELEAICKSGEGLGTLAIQLDQLAPLLSATHQSLTQANLLLDPDSLQAQTSNLTKIELYTNAAGNRAALTESETKCLRKLDGLLEDFNLEALQYFTEIRSQLQAHGALCEALDEAFQGLDLAQAHALCSLALSK